MIQTAGDQKTVHRSIEARRLAELARAAGFGDSPDDAFGWIDEALSILGSDEETPLVADVFRWQGTVLRDLGRTTQAAANYTRSLEISTKLRYDRGRAHALNEMASISLRRGELVQASQLMTDALALADRSGDTRLVGMLQQNLGIVADIRGNPAAALAHYRISLGAFEATNDLQPLCWVLNNLGYLHLKEQRYDDALATFDRALGIARARGELLSEGIIEENRAELRLVLGQLDESAISFNRALDIADQRGDSVRAAAALKLKGAHERMSGSPALAVRTLERSMALSSSGEDALLGAEILYQIGMAHHALGDRWTAGTVWRAALEAFERISARQWVGRVQKQLTHGDSARYF